MEQRHNDIAYTILEQPPIRAVGYKRAIRGKMEERQAAAAVFWKQLSDGGKLPALLELGGAPILGVSTHFSKDGYDLYACVETQAEPPDGMEVLEIAGGPFASFPCESASPEAVRACWATIYDKWFFSSGYGHLGTAEVEVYPRYEPAAACELRAPVKKFEPKEPPRQTMRSRGVFVMVLCALVFLLIGSVFNGPSSVPLLFAAVGLFVGVMINHLLKKRDEKKAKEKENSDADG